MGGDSGSISFTKQLKQNKKLVRQLIVAGSTFFALILFFKACHNNNDTTSPNSTETRGKSPFFAAPPPTPNIVWLMTLPSSGSSFVLSLVTRATDLSMATNYGQDVTPLDQFSISINPRDDCGPYWAGLGDVSSKTRRKLPTNNILVQTYCQTKTTPLVPTLEEYLQDCVTTFGRTAPDPSILTQHSYEPSRVTKTIHLVRDPFTQMITKFQKEYKSHTKDTSWRRDFPPTKKGFLKWCRADDEKMVDVNDEYYSAGTVQIMSETPCSRFMADYIQWHNHAFDTSASLRIPELVVYYEDLYDDVLETTLRTLVEFVDLEQETMPSQRLGNRGSALNVNDFLSRNDQKQIRRLVQKLATDETWSHVERYFQDLL